MPLDPVPTDFSTPAPVYQDDRGELWEVIGYITHPATCLRNIKTGERHVEIIGCKNAERFTRLDRAAGSQRAVGKHPDLAAPFGNYETI